MALELYKGSLKGVEGRFYPDPVFIVDEKELLIMFPKISEDILDLDKVVALWIPSQAVASSMADMFNVRWNEYIKMQTKT